LWSKRFAKRLAVGAQGRPRVGPSTTPRDSLRRPPFPFSTCAGVACALRHDVVLVTFGRAATLAPLLRSLRAQTRPPDRILIVDDTPDDSVRDVARAEGVDYSRNPGPPAITTARNHGIDATDGDLLTFLDNDVTISPDYLERIGAALAADPKAIAAAGHVTNLIPMGRFKRGIAIAFGLNRRTPGDCRLLPNLNTTYPMVLSTSKLVDWMWGCNMTVRREAFQRVRFETQFTRYSLYEDIEFSLNLQRAFPDRHILMVEGARLQDVRSDEARLGFEDVLRMRTINRLYIMHKHGRKPAFAVPRLLWTDLGGLAVKLASEPKQVPSGLRGLVRGWWAVARHRKDLRRGDLSRLNEGYDFRRKRR
jgi:GT2 family glycosyltransferase